MKLESTFSFWRDLVDFKGAHLKNYQL